MINSCLSFFCIHISIWLTICTNTNISFRAYCQACIWGKCQMCKTPFLRKILWKEHNITTLIMSKVSHFMCTLPCINQSQLYCKQEYLAGTCESILESFYVFFSLRNIWTICYKLPFIIAAVPWKLFGKILKQKFKSIAKRKGPKDPLI